MALEEEEALKVEGEEAETEAVEGEVKKETLKVDEAKAAAGLNPEQKDSDESELDTEWD